MSNLGGDTIKIMLVEDHDMVRTALRMMIANWPDCCVVAEAAERTEALRQAAEAQPDIILLDVNLRGDSALSFIPELLAVAREASVILLTAVENRDTHLAAARLGAKGVVLKEQAASTLQRAIERVYAGEIWLERTLVSDLLDTIGRPPPPLEVDPNVARIATLSEREHELIALIAEGLQNKHIARRMSLSEKTVAHHLTSIFHKLGVGNRLELVIFAYNNGLGRRSDKPF